MLSMCDPLKRFSMPDHADLPVMPNDADLPVLQMVRLSFWLDDVVGTAVALLRSPLQCCSMHSCWLLPLAW